ncbi:annexin A1 [Gastrophryne carolinensis]
MAFMQAFLANANFLGEEQAASIPAANAGPSVHATAGYNAATDAANLEKAIKAKGVDEGTIIDILAKRTNCERQQIKAAYQQQTGKNLDDALKKALKSHLEEVVLALMKTPAQYDAHCLRNAIKGLGTDESTLVEILVSRNNSELREIIKVYKEEFKKDLAKDVASDTSGDFQKALLAILSCNRSESTAVNEEQADNDARALFVAGEQRKGTDVAAFINILTARSPCHLRQVFSKYRKYSSNDMAKAIDLELKGDIENTLMSIVKVATSKPIYFAERFNLAMKGSGTRHKDLIRLLVSRCEVDLKEIKYHYKRMYGKPLGQAIKEEKLKGDYELIMLCLCGPDEYMGRLNKTGASTKTPRVSQTPKAGSRKLPEMFGSQRSEDAYPRGAKMAEAPSPGSSPEREEDVASEGEDGGLTAQLSQLPTRTELAKFAGEIKASIAEAIADLRADMRKLSSRVEKVEKEEANTSNRLSEVREVVMAHNRHLMNVHRHLEDLDNRNRRCNIRVRGVPEEVAPDQTQEALLSIFNSLLERPPGTPIEFVRAHRALRPRSMGEAPPRDIICCLQNFQLKEEILSKARNRDTILFNNSEETHFQIYRAPYLGNRTYTSCYSALSPNNKAKGVSILVDKDLDLRTVAVEKDKEGRYIFLKGKLPNGSVITVANVYAPNKDQQQFCRVVLGKLGSFQEGMLIMGGDLNCALNPLVDTSDAKTAISFRALKQIKKALQELALVDTWRMMHPTGKDFTYYSPVHVKYTRIDFLFLSQRDLERVISAQIGNISFSDHAPVVLSMALPGGEKREWNWRMNESLLKDPGVVERIRQHLSLYIKENATEGVDPVMVWEAHKCTLRGYLIQEGARAKRERGAKAERLVQQIADLELKHKRSLQAPVLQELESKRQELKDVLFRETSRFFTRRHGLFYEQGNKAGRLLARALRPKQAKIRIEGIRGSDGIFYQKNGEIADLFRRFYLTLYNLPVQQGKRDVEGSMEAYLMDSGMPSLSEEEVEQLEAPITVMELQKAIKASKPGRTPGPDGFSSQYYKTFSDQLLPLMARAFESTATSGSLPRSALEAQIVVIPKGGKDATDCRYYRPISLLNVDVKIFAKALAGRLASLLPGLIDQDQVGFVPGREAHDNVIKALNIQWWAKAKGVGSIMLSTDAEKAFDRVDCRWIGKVLDHVGLGAAAKNRVMALYSNPVARLRHFFCSKGVKEGLKKELTEFDRACLDPSLTMAFIQEFLRQAQFLEGFSESATQQQVSAGVKGAPSYDASADVAALDKAIKVKGVDEATITKILTKRSNAQRQAIKAAYKNSTGKPLEEDMKKALSGNYERVVLALLLTPAEFDAQELYLATKGLGTNEDDLIEILASRTPEQIRAIKIAYKEKYKNDLSKDITSDTSGHFQKALLALIEASRSTDTHVNDELVENHARAFYAAGEQRKGTDVNVLINILTTYSYAHLRKMFQRYTAFSKNDVAKALDLELKGDIEKLLIAIVKCATCTPAFFAERLHLSMKGSGTRDKDLIRNIVCRSEIDMSEIRDQYKRMYGRTLRQDVLDDTKGDYENVLLELVGVQVVNELFKENVSVIKFLVVTDDSKMEQQSCSVVQQMLQAGQQKKDTRTEAHDVQAGSNWMARHRSNPLEDANTLEKAVTAKDAGSIIDILANRTNEQRQVIKEAYQKKTGKSLEEGLKKGLSGKVEKLMIDLLKTPAQYDAHEIKAAMKGLGTDEEALIEITISRSNQQMENIKKAYKQEFKTALEEDIIDDTSGDFQKALVALVKGARSEDHYVNEELADKDAKALYEAGEKKKKADVSSFIELFTCRSFPHLKRMFELYPKYSQHDLNKMLDLQLKGDIESCLVAIVKYAVNKAVYFAEKLQLAMKGLGVQEKVLNRVIISRSENDLKAIKAAYKQMYGRSLREDIMAETNGEYETALITILGYEE